MKITVDERIGLLMTVVAAVIVTAKTNSAAWGLVVALGSAGPMLAIRSWLSSIYLVTAALPPRKEDLQ